MRSSLARIWVRTTLRESIASKSVLTPGSAHPGGITIACKHAAHKLSGSGLRSTGSGGLRPGTLLIIVPFVFFRPIFNNDNPIAWGRVPYRRRITWMQSCK